MIVLGVGFFNSGFRLGLGVEFGQLLKLGLRLEQDIYRRVIVARVHVVEAICIYIPNHEINATEKVIPLFCIFEL